MDGGADVTEHFALSGETPIPQIILNNPPMPQKTALEIAALNVAKREWQKMYMDYWNSTAELTGTGRPVDGVFCPAAPHAAVIPLKYAHVGYTSFLNTLDYTTVVIPVTRADKAVDVPYTGDQFLSDKDRTVQGECKRSIIYCRAKGC